MSEKSVKNARVVLSFIEKNMDLELIKKLTPEDLDAIRFIVKAGNENEAISFLDKIKKSSAAIIGKVPFAIDVCNWRRATIVGLDVAKDINFGDKLVFAPEGSSDCDFQVNAVDWEKVFVEDCKVVIGHGMAELKILNVSDKKVTLEVVQGGTVYPASDVHVPSTRNERALRDLSPETMKLASHELVDAVVIPQMSSVEHHDKLVSSIHALPNKPWVILGVTSKRCYENIDSYLGGVRGILISRVDLSMDFDPAQIPMITKNLIHIANEGARFTLIASETLGSMRHNATPTRAEVSDIANAVIDGADGIVLSRDVTTGKYAERALMLARKSIRDVEQGLTSNSMTFVKDSENLNTDLWAITSAAVKAAERSHAKALVCITKNGNTALHLSSFGGNIPVVALTQTNDLDRKFRFIKGVLAYNISELPNLDEVLPLINNILSRKHNLVEGDKYVFVSVTISSVGDKNSNMFTIQSLSN